MVLLPRSLAAAATTARCGLSRLGRWKRRLRSKNFRERCISAHLVRISATHADRTNQLIFHDDRQAATDEVISEAGGLTEV